MPRRRDLSLAPHLSDVGLKKLNSCSASRSIPRKYPGLAKKQSPLRGLHNIDNKTNEVKHPLHHSKILELPGVGGGDVFGKERIFTLT